jgi:hypothetical protein
MWSSLPVGGQKIQLSCRNPSLNSLLRNDLARIFLRQYTCPTTGEHDESYPVRCAALLHPAR